jgi:hypothetical protein
MIFNRHAPIISYHIDTIFFNSPGGKIPIARKPNIRFDDLPVVNKKPPVTEFHLLAFASHHPLQKHDPASGKTYGDHIMSFRLRKKVSQPPTKVDSSVGIGWLHAGPLNREGRTEIAEKKKSGDRDQGDPDQEHGGQRGEKKLSNPAMDGRLRQRLSLPESLEGGLPALDSLFDGDLLRHAFSIA